jgi:hypothetical protein
VCKFSFTYFTDLLIFKCMGIMFFLPLLCSTAFEADQDPHAQPHDVGWAVRGVHTSYGVLTTCSARHLRSAADGRRRVDGIHGSVASGDTHVPPSV